MKTRRLAIDETIGERSGGCCDPTIGSDVKNDPCCEQPLDGSSCCDKSATREANVAATGCC